MKSIKIRIVLAVLALVLVMYANAFLVVLASAKSSFADEVIFGTGTNTFAMEFSLVEGAGNIAQSSANRDHSQRGGDGLGAVSYDYKIGAYQVTIDQFTKAQVASGNPSASEMSISARRLNSATGLPVVA